MKRILLIAGGVVLTAVLVLVIIVVQFTKASEVISEGTPIPDYQEEKSAVMVIDIQECTTGKYSREHSYQNQSSGLFFRVNAVIEEAKSRSIPIIYIKNEITHPIINFLDNSMQKGSPGAELDRGLVIASNNIFSKDKLDAFSNPALDEFLQQEKISKLYVTGLDVAYCVKSTVEAALNRKYEIVLVEDAIISESNELKNRALKELKTLGCKTILAEEF